MVVCLLALFVFGFMAIFSATYRPAAKEALNCVFRRMTLRKCDTGFDKKIKAKIAGKLMAKHPKAAQFIFKHFEVLSWTFTILLFASIAWAVWGLYHLIILGICPT